MPKLHPDQATVNQSPLLLPIVAQAEQLATLTQTVIQQPIQINPPQLSAIAYREAIRLLTKLQRLIYDYLFDWLPGPAPRRRHTRRLS